MPESNYQIPDIEGTEKFYKRSVWLIGHREKFKKLGIAAWIFLDALLILFSLWVVIDTFLISYETERGLLREMLVENRTGLYQSTQSQVASGLKIEGAPTVLASGEGKYDLVAFVTNSNKDWWAEFVYQMNIGSDAKSDLFSSFVYPGETCAVVVLAQEAVRISSASLEIVSTAWHRVDPHDIPDFKSWFDERMNLKISDAKFTPIAESESGSSGIVSFSAANNTAFSYWSVPFYILLKRGNSVVGVSSTSVEQFESGETREVNVGWLQSIPTVTDVVVMPTLNIFDLSVYMPPRSSSSIDTRTRMGE